VSEERDRPEAPERASLAVLWLVPIILVLDQVTKFIVVKGMDLRESIDVFGSFVRLTYIHNPGAAFGLKIGGPVLHTVFSLIALGVIGWLFWTVPAGARLLRSALAMVLGGALGNIIDRIRIEAGVIDFIDVGISHQWRWPIFNVADSFVTIGIIMLAIGYARQRDEPDHDA
jgi:signal peptidase II